MFTKTQWELILHRLEISDAVAEVLSDSDIGEYETIKERAEFLIEHKPNEIEELQPLDLFILRECCEGSTFFADIGDAVERGEMTKGKMMSYYRAAYKLEEILNVNFCMF